MDPFMDILAQVLDIAQEPLVGILTVYVMMGLKWLLRKVDELPAAVQQLMVPFVAYGITWLGTLLNLALPTDLGQWTASTTSAVISAGIAYGVHAGKKIKEKNGGGG